MSIQFAVHTYGHPDAMFLVLNGIKMIMNSDFADSLIKLTALIATSYYALLGMAGASQGQVGTYFLKTVGMLLVITALLLPKADIMVVDRVNKKKEIVSDLPYAFVLPVGVFEAMGAGMTSLFEQAFSTVSSAPYKDYGMIFGSRIVQESKNWKIANPEFARNMDIFLARCVVLEAMIGTHFTPEDIKSSKDLLTLVTDNAGTFRTVDFRVNKKPAKLTCKEAGDALKQYFNEEASFLNFKYKKRDFAVAGGSNIGLSHDIDNGKLNRSLARNLEIGYGSALGVQGKAEDIVRQNMMINSIKDFNNKTDLYAYTRASDLQKSNWAVAGELAKEYLPLLLDVMKALIYASFIFLVPLMILAGGMAKYAKYCQLVFSLQIWPALNSVLNLFIELYSNVRGSGITGGALTMANFEQAHGAVDTIVLVASGLQMSIPFLSFAIVQGAVQGFIHLAGQVQAASSGAASAVSQEVTSGSRSFDNISRGSESIDQKSGFKTDWNQSFQEGATQVQGASGAMFRSFADGSSAISSGNGINLSSGSRRFGLEESTQSGYQQSLTNTLSALKGEEQNYNQAKSNTISSTADLVSHIAQRESAGESFSYDKMGEQGKALQQAVNHSKELHDQNDYSWNQSAGVSVKAYADIGVKTPDSLPLIKASGGVAVDGTVAANNISNQSLSENQRTTQGNDTNKSFTNLVKAAQNEQWMKDNSIDNSFAESTRASYEQMQSYQQSVSQKREEADSYSAALQHSQNSGATDSRDMYHEVEQGVMQQYGVSQGQAHQMIETNDTRANKVWDGIVQQNMASGISQVANSRAYVDATAKADAREFSNNNAHNVNDQGLQDLKTQAANHGLNKDSVQGNIQGQKEELQSNYGNMTDENATQYNSVLHHNKVVGDALQQRADKYEEDRIGQGNFVAPILGTLAQIPTLGHAGNLNIGGPSSVEKAKLNLGGFTEQAPQLPFNNKSTRGKSDK